MTQPFRTPSGGRIRRDQPIRFTFDGRAFEGYAGDTLASALLANGVHLVGRSFKYHRPRGIMSAGSEEPNALVTIDRGDGPRHAQSARHHGRALRRPDRPDAKRLAFGPVRSRRRRRTRVAAVVGRILLQDLHVARVVLAAPV